jgi:uncharacterized protein YcaQ
MEKISQPTARRIAIAAQGLHSRATATPTARHLDSVIARIGLLQMDSVAILARAHYLPLYARLGAYNRSLLDEAAWGKKRRWFEYWGHEASLLPFALQPLLRWRMAAATNGEGLWPNLTKFHREHGPYIKSILAHITKNGPTIASDLEGEKGEAGWWGWGQAKRALEFLFWSGELTTHGRRGFERVYDIPERVLPAAILAQPTPTKADAQRELLRLSACAHGVGNVTDLADYFRISPRTARPLIAELAEEGTLRPVEIAGLRGEWFLHRNARIPRQIDTQTLLSPFDPLIWERDRVAKLFAFQYRLEIYTPAHKRVHGYYVLPFLLNDRLVARVDLKADRATSTLHVLAAYAEPDAPAETPGALRSELNHLATWLALDSIVIVNRGDLANRLGKSTSF